MKKNSTVLVLLCIIFIVTISLSLTQSTNSTSAQTFQPNHSPDNTYVTHGLKDLWTHTKGGFYHDGRFATLMDVVNHYNDFKNLSLKEDEKKDLVEYLKSL